MNTSFELWLLACNVAYLFERTPFYRPWLAWVGVDLRRLNADDFVSVTPAIYSTLIQTLNFLLAACNQSCASCYSSCSAWDHETTLPTFDEHSSTNTRLFEASLADRHFFHQIFRVVLLSRIPSTFLVGVSPRSGRPTPADTPAPPSRNTCGWHDVWALSIMPKHHKQRDCFTIWLRLLLPLCI